eukprot:1995294-Pyramimonas_sp.AAC.1
MAGKCGRKQLMRLQLYNALRAPIDVTGSDKANAHVTSLCARALGPFGGMGHSNKRLGKEFLGACA